MSYYSKRVNRIKDEIKENEYPLSFIENDKPYHFRNCYAYALGLSVKDPLRKIYIPGCISDETENDDVFGTQGLMKRLKRDFDFLGFSYRENDEVLKEGEYRIAIYATPSICYGLPIGFHFNRQDNDGYWSEKKNWHDKPTRLDYWGINAPDIPINEHFKTVLIIKKN